MKKIIALIATLYAAPGLTHGATIAVCGEQSGKSYFPHVGMTASSDVGWHDNGISGGITTLIYTGAGEYDLLFYDATKVIRSTVGEGGFVNDLHIGDRIASFVVSSSDTAIDVYSFVETVTGTYEMTRTANRLDEAYFPNASVFVAQCAELNFDVLNEIRAEREAAVAVAKEAAQAAYKAAKEAARSSGK